MKVINKETATRTVELITSKCFCDKCHEEITTKKYDAFECSFYLRTGNNFPESGSGENKSMDLCSNCADGLIDLLRNNGYRINESEWDW